MKRVPPSDPLDLGRGAGPGIRPGPDPEPPIANTRFFGVYRIDPERYSRDFTRLSQEILQQLTALDGVDLEVTVEVRLY